MLIWSTVERDIITELLNIGMGQAGRALSELLQEEVLLSIPQVDLVSRDNASEFVANLTSEELVSVCQEFGGPFGGNAILLFSDNHSLELVRALLADEILLEDLPDLEQEAVSEVGNIVLNACMSGMADALGQEIPMNLPKFHKGAPSSLMEQEVDSQGMDDALFLLARVQFDLKALDVVGYLALFMCVESANRLRQELNKLFESLQVAE